MTLNELLKSKKIYQLHDKNPIGSLLTLKKWINKDISKDNILETYIQGEGQGRRYFINEDKIDDFIKAVKNNYLQ